MHRVFVPLPPLFCTQSRSNRISCTVMLFGAPAGPVIVLVPTESEMRSWSAPSFSGSPGSKKLNVLQVSPAGQAASNEVPQPCVVVVEQYPFCRRSNCPLHTNAWACVGNPAAAIARSAASPPVIAHRAAPLWETCIISLLVPIGFAGSCLLSRPLKDTLRHGNFPSRIMIRLALVRASSSDHHLRRRRLHQVVDRQLSHPIRHIYLASMGFQESRDPLLRLHEALLLLSRTTVVNRPRWYSTSQRRQSGASALRRET